MCTIGLLVLDSVCGWETRTGDAQTNATKQHLNDTFLSATYVVYVDAAIAVSSDRVALLEIPANIKFINAKNIKFFTSA